VLLPARVADGAAAVPAQVKPQRRQVLLARRQVLRLVAGAGVGAALRRHRRAAMAP